MKDIEGAIKRRAVIQKKHKVLFDEISAVLFELDPVGINFVDNTDEYDPEVGTILPRLGSCKSAEDVKKVVAEEFATWFGEDGERCDYTQAGLEIWDVWQRSGKPTIDGEQNNQL